MLEEQVVENVETLRIPQNARQLLAAMSRLYKYELTDTESMLWEMEIFSRYPDETVMRALKAHMESGSADAKFMPRYGVIKRMLEPTGNFLQIVQAVKNVGPYGIPDIDDPVLIAAIHQMGGWVAVCTEMPDARERPIDFDRYLKRFDVALAAGQTEVSVRGIEPLPLTAIGIGRDAAPQIATEVNTARHQVRLLA